MPPLPPVDVGHRRLFPAWRHSARPIEAERALASNGSPCARCGRVYPWRGHASKVAWVLRRLRGRCPGCFLGYPADRRPSPAELLDRFRRSWGSSRAGRGWTTAPRGGDA